MSLLFLLRVRSLLREPWALFWTFGFPLLIALTLGLAFRERTSSAPGLRYIDFLIPGLIGYGLMSAGIWGVGSVILQLRTGKMLQRLAATPMNRGHFLLSFFVWRGALGVVEILFLLGVSRLVFGVRVAGDFLSFIVFGLMGSLSFAGISLLAASRARNLESATGAMNLTSLVMGFLSGVFFPVSHFPVWMQAIVEWIPLTALNQGLRDILVDGAGLLSLWREALVLGIWGIASFLVTLRTFRWSS
ncbi:ABC transporter permease [Archangium lansingense]|uniref:Transport permease protein n=1 Tax=Archangium lansingense TaxID=2995310 RepID=A0ABT4ANY0_9BACT|nr:ABC transporter permease [Archangium lansinium]MCY1083399.1 ABC transporter permease [Archangium lansinium]